MNSEGLERNLGRQHSESVRESVRRYLAGWAGIEDRPPAAQESWWFPEYISIRGRHQPHHNSGQSDSADTSSTSSFRRYASGTTQGNGISGHKAANGAAGAGEAEKADEIPATKRRSRKRDWFKVLLAARNLATFVYALSNTTSLPMLPFMANRLIFPRESMGPDDPGSEGVPELWRGMAYGLVMSGYHMTKVISAPWIGFLSDRVGRRQALVMTLLGGALVFMVTKMWGQYSIQGLIVCRLLMGCFAANGALMHAYIRDTVPQEWQSSAFSQHSASWGCAYLAAPAVIAWAGDSADRILTLATVTMVISAAVVEITFVDTRPEGHRTQRMSSVVGEYLIEGARDLAEVGKKMSGLDLAEYFNAGKEKEPSPVGIMRSSSEGLLRHRNVVINRSSGANGHPVGANGYTSMKNGRGSVDPPKQSVVASTKVKDNGGVCSKDRRRSPEEGLSGRALVGVFQGMMKQRLVLVTFVLQVIRPAQDLAPLVARKFSGGASVLAGINSSRSLCRALVPMTPLIPSLVRLAGGSSSEGAAAKMRGDRAVAALMCVLMAVLVAVVPAVDTLQDLHRLMFFNGLCYIVRDSTAGAVMARAAGTASVGAFFGWQHCIKGIQGTFSTFLTGWLSGYSVSLPYYVVAVCDLIYAFTYLYM